MHYNILNTIKKHISFIVLLLVFFIPTVVKLDHAFDEDHGCKKICASKKNSKENNDTEEDDCKICDYQLAPFAQFSNTYFSFIPFEKTDTYYNDYKSLQYSFISTSFLRGPPSLS